MIQVRDISAADSAELRREGIGALVLDALVEHCRREGGGELWCNARTGAQNFYLRGSPRSARSGSTRRSDRTCRCAATSSRPLVTTGNPFDDHQEAWMAYRASPWGRLRYAVVAQTLAEALGEEPLRILDVGGGDGGDALPLAVAGHDVAVLDDSPAMLEAAAKAGLQTIEGTLDGKLPAGFNAVLCGIVDSSSGGLRPRRAQVRPQ